MTITASITSEIITPIKKEIRSVLDLIPQALNFNDWAIAGASVVDSRKQFTTSGAGGVRLDNLTTGGESIRVILSGETTADLLQFRSYDSSANIATLVNVVGGGVFNVDLSTTQGVGETGFYFRCGGAGVTKLYLASVLLLS